jgi:hypothetical protein
MKRATPEKSRLMDQYSAAIAEFSRAAGIVNTRMETMYKGDYERLKGSRHVGCFRNSSSGSVDL